MGFNIKKSILVFLFLLVIFISSVIVWYSPILFKGFVPYKICPSINAARNISTAGFFSLESNLNVVLASSLVAEQGEISSLGSKFTAFSYSGIQNVFGSFSPQELIFTDIILRAVALLLFTILVSNLFNRKTGLLFALVYIFLPFNWRASYSIGSYEFALIFIALFSLFYFQAEKKNIQRYARFFWILAGVFLAGAVLSKECFILVPTFLVLFLLWKKRKEALIFIMIPFVLLMSVFWLPNFIQRSIYFNLLTGVPIEKSASVDFSFYGHFYPDPYTYHFNKDAFLQENLEKYNQGTFSVEKIEKLKIMENIGAKKISFLERLKVGLIIGSRHVFRLFSLEDVGGPFVFLLILLGLYSLRRKNRYLYQFFVCWLFLSIFLMSFIILVVRSHLVDFNWAIALMITLGIFTIVRIVSKYFGLKKKKIMWIQILVFGAVLYNFVLATHVLLGRVYNDTSVLQMEAYSQLIKPLDIDDKEVIALDVPEDRLYHLNYLTDKSLVIFRAGTIKDLIEENKLEFAFEKFNVGYIIGYSDDLSEKIIEQVNIVNIGSSPIEPVEPDISRNKGWFMNLIK